MAELIREDDTLNQGRKKLNNAIRAFNETVVEGDSSVEAAQARVDKDGKTYGTLKERLDTEHGIVTSQLAETENKNISDNAAYIEPFSIKTFDGSNEPYHPSVVYFSDPDGWNGCRSWMAYTPFPISNVPPYRDRWECPSILRSPDGQDWRKPFNAPNPLIDLTQEEIDRGDYFSDPCIVMNGQTMEIWYRKTNGANRTQTDIYRITTDDGETFTEPEIVLAPLRPDNGFPGTMGMRAQQVFLNGSKYEAFFSLQGGEIGRAHV